MMICYGSAILGLYICIGSCKSRCSLVLVWISAFFPIVLLSFPFLSSDLTFPTIPLCYFLPFAWRI